MLHDIETPRFLISQLTERHYDQLYQIMTDKEFMRFLPELSDEYSAFGGIKIFATSFDRFKTTGRGLLLGMTSDDRLLGFIAIMDLPENPTVFYATHPAYRNKGIMVEAVSLVIKQLFRLGLCTRIRTEIYKENIASIKVVSKSGFRQIGENDEKSYWEINGIGRPCSQCDSPDSQ